MATPTAEHSGPLSGSFRDPSGFVFRRDGVLYRQVNGSYREHFEQLLATGLFAFLVAKGLIVDHEDVDLDLRHTDDAWRVIKPSPIPFVSYPY